MKNSYQKESLHTDAIQIYVETPPIPLIKSKIDFKIERDYDRIKLRINPMS